MWMMSEVKILREMYPTAAKDDIIAALPRHSSWSAICVRAAAFGVRRIGRVVSEPHPSPIMRALCERRNKNRTSATKLASTLDVDRVSVHRWERDAAGPRLDVLERWADALGFELVLVEKAQVSAAPTIVVV